MRRSGVLAALLLTAAVGSVPRPAEAQLVDVLAAQLEVETELQDAALQRFRQARQRERDAISNFEGMANQHDGALGNRSTPAATLRQRERSISQAAQLVALNMRETARLRAELYDRRERIELLAQQIRDLREEPLVRSSGLTGVWQVEVEPQGLFGIMRFHAEGTLVTGSYRLSNGEQGSLRGTVADNQVQIDRIDADRGFTATLKGELNPMGGTIDGTWRAIDVSGGAPGSGSWNARRLGPGGRQVSSRQEDTENERGFF